MSLSFPSNAGPMASFQAQENILKLSRVNQHGPKDQVATRVALECFNRQQELQPGYFQGTLSWMKSGVVYLGTGAATLALYGGLAFGAYKAAVAWGYVSNTQLAAGAGAFLATSALTSWLGFNPVRYIFGILGLTIRDAATRGADWSIRNDTRTLKEKEYEAIQCHKTIVSHLSTVYNDCANKLHEMLENAESARDPSRILKLQQSVNNLDDHIPDIKIQLKKLKLDKHEIEIILQRLSNSIKYVQTQTSQLKPHSEKRNISLIGACPVNSVGKMAIPQNIQERMDVSRNSQFGLGHRIKGYVGSILSGGLTGTGLTAAIGAAAALFFAHRYGLNASFSYMKEGYMKPDFSVLGSINSLNLTQKAIFGTAALVPVVASTGVLISSARTEHSHNVANRTYVQEELSACKKELKEIYDDMAQCFSCLPPQERQRQARVLTERLPAINRAIKYQGLKPSEITGYLEQVMISRSI